MNETVQASKRQQEDSNPDSLDGESDGLTTTPPRSLLMMNLTLSIRVKAKVIAVCLKSI